MALTVNAQHRDYKAFYKKWERCRDCYEGSDAVKARGVLYLPALEGHSQTDPKFISAAYQGYLARAMFYPAESRTVAGLSGLVFAKPPTIEKELSKDILEELKDVTLTGVSMFAFGLDICMEVLAIGRGGVLVDLPADAAPGARPYWTKYKAEDILNWRTTRINGQQVLTLVVVRELDSKPSDGDEFVDDVTNIYRVLKLEKLEGSDEMVYTVALYYEDEKNAGVFIQKGAKMVPRVLGNPIGFIPFTFFGPSTITPTPEHPPLLDLVDTNLSHYRTSADREHGAHFTGLPTPWVAGHTLAAGETLAIGSGTAWVFESEQAKVGMLEFQGQGLGALEKLMQEKERLMITLGAKMLEMQKAANETATAVKMRHSGEKSALAVLADAVGQGLTQCLRRHLILSGQTPEESKAYVVTMNPDLLESLSTEEVKTLMLLWQAGGVSKKTLYYNLQWGEWARPDVTFEQEEEDIKRETPEEPSEEEAIRLAEAEMRRRGQPPPTTEQ